MSDVSFNNIHNSSFNIENVAGRDIIKQQAQSRRACPTPPAPPEKFGGRDDDLNALVQALREGKDSAVTALYGGGGIGKTTLVRQVAQVQAAIAAYHDAAGE